MSVSVSAADVVVSGWELDLERELASQKQKELEEARKRAEDRRIMLEEEDRIYQAKKRAKEERVKAMMEKKKKEVLWIFILCLFYIICYFGMY